ncbi:MAG: VWA domain-containing protein [Bacteroidia bacterium]
MRSLFILIAIVFCLTGSAQKVAEHSHNFGKVKLWNNPIFETTFTNTSNETLLFLPLRSERDLQVRYGKSSLKPGESTSIQVQYFTEEFGKFNRTVDVFVSIQDEPISLSVRGTIKSFHPEALTVCPSIENRGTVTTPGFVHTIKVVDLETNEVLTDYDLEILTPLSKENIEVNEPSVNLKRDKPQFYYFTVDKEGYEIAKEQLYVQRNTKETTFYLKKEVIDLVENQDTFDFNEIENEEDIPVASATGLEDTLDKNELIDDQDEMEEVIDTSDFSEDGKLNSSKYAYNNLVFLIDVSTSMRNEDKLPLLKYSMLQMIEVLRPEDVVSIITYSTEAVVLVDKVSGIEKEYLAQKISSLEAKGHSYGKEAVNVAYDKAKEHLISDGNNEIILASDGIFNSKNFSEKKMYRKALMQYAAYDVRLSTIGFGHTSRALRFLETLARKGNGSYIVIKTEEEANSTLIQNMMSHSLK